MRKFWAIGGGARRKPGRPWKFREKRVYDRKRLRRVREDGS